VNNIDYNSLHKFTIDFLEMTINVSIGSTFIDALGKVEPSMVIDENPSTRGMTIEYDEAGTCVIIIPEDVSLSTVVHESTHCVNFILKTFALPCTPEDDELMAYLMSFVVDRVYDALEAHQNQKIAKEVKTKKTKKTKTKK
jgi:hypothetical protein